MLGCGQPTTNRGRGGPDLPPLGADLSIPALGGFLVVGWWLSGQGAFSPLSHVPDLRTPPVFLIQVLILEFFVWHLLLEMFMGRGNSCLSPGDFCSHQQSTSRESAGSGQEPKSQVNYPHHFFASLLPHRFFTGSRRCIQVGDLGFFRFSCSSIIQVLIWDSICYIAHCSERLVWGACMLQCRQPKSHGFSQPFHRAGWGCTYTIWCPSI